MEGRDIFGRKKSKLNADSYRLLDIIMMTFLGALSIILVFMISLGYAQIPTYMPVIKNCAYFVGYLPAFASSLVHAIINFACSHKENKTLMDFNGVPSGKRGIVGLYMALIGTAVSLLFIILLLSDVFPMEDYLLVLASLPMALLPYVFFLFDQIQNYVKARERKGYIISIFLFLGFALPIGIGLGTYLPGYGEWGYSALCLIPFVYLITDSISMKKKGTDIESLDDL